MKEIVSIQIGSYANFVGSHFWNLQDEFLGLQSQTESDSCFRDSGLNMDVLYRVGETLQGVSTYTPRLLAIDTRGSLGSVKATGSLYDDSSHFPTSSVPSWKGKVARHIAEPHEKNTFLQSLDEEEVEWKSAQDGPVNKENLTETNDKEETILQCLENSVQFWTDYSKVHFHPRSLYQLEGVWHDITPIDDFGSGKGLLTGFSKEDVLDRLRFFVEETDCFQGIQVVVDDSNGFAGIASDFLEAVGDEYDKSPVLLFTVRPTSSFVKTENFYAATARELHNAVSFSQLSSFSKCTIPLGLPSFSKMSRYLRVNDSKNFHTSAVYASAISCATIPFRMELSDKPLAVSEKTNIGGLDIPSLINTLSCRGGGQVAILDSAMPGPAVTGSEEPEGVDLTRFQSLTSDIADTDEEAKMEVFAVQGALLAGSSSRASIQDVISTYGQNRKSPCYVAASICPLALPLPFPDIFLPNSLSAMHVDKSSIPISSRLRVSVAVMPYLESRFRSLQKLTTGSIGWQVLEGWGVQKEEVSELKEHIANIISGYGGSPYISASDSD